ncbi:MAG: ECF transporter S component [Lachnospiraceae bacterium]|jgi:energy-coupling factor transport system substrate-specific component|nr:ECF transporter S component [Lachnospiraceae bacterium]
MRKKRIRARRLVIIAVMTALSTAGRFIPVIKPVSAVTIITGMYLGGAAGFTTGALSALLSNFYFGQGPWTPFQMLAWGLTGLFSHILSKFLKKNRFLLLAHGALWGILFSLIMDVWTVIWMNGEWSAAPYLAALLSAVPHTVTYIVSNVLFLALLARPMGEKLERVKLKYGV